MKEVNVRRIRTLDGRGNKSPRTKKQKEASSKMMLRRNIMENPMKNPDRSKRPKNFKGRRPKNAFPPGNNLATKKAQSKGGFKLAMLKFGEPRNAEHSKKISKALKGKQVPWNKGKKMSEEYKRIRAEAYKRIRSEVMERRLENE